MINPLHTRNSGHSGSLWLGGLRGWHSPDDPKVVRVDSHYGFGWLRFYWTYDPLARDFPDTMSEQVVVLSAGRGLPLSTKPETG